MLTEVNSDSSDEPVAHRQPLRLTKLYNRNLLSSSSDGLEAGEVASVEKGANNNIGDGDSVVNGGKDGDHDGRIEGAIDGAHGNDGEDEEGLDGDGSYSKADGGGESRSDFEGESESEDIQRRGVRSYFDDEAIEDTGSEDELSNEEEESDGFISANDDVEETGPKWSKMLRDDNTNASNELSSNSRSSPSSDKEESFDGQNCSDDEWKDYAPANARRTAKKERKRRALKDIRDRLKQKRKKE